MDAKGRMVGMISQNDLFNALMSLTGVKRRGIHLAFEVEDRPGSIKDLTDIIRRYDGRDWGDPQGKLQARFDLVGPVDRLTGPIDAELGDLSIVGEVQIPIAHQLIAWPGVTLTEVKKVYSHPQALAQCEQSITRLLPHAERVSTYDTAGSSTRRPRP